MRVAVLDDQGRLVGAREVKKPKAGDIDCGDLPADGTYRFVDGAFYPLGHGFPRVAAQPPVTADRALYDLILSLGDAAPSTSRAWAAWYGQHLRQREEEMARAQARRPRRGAK